MIEFKVKDLDPGDEFTIDHGASWNTVKARPRKPTEDELDDLSCMDDDVVLATDAGDFYLSPLALVVVR